MDRTSMQDDAKHWRQLAQLTRAAADQHGDPDAKETLRVISECYEQLAVLAEKRVTSRASQ
jgi:hypothetical protein